MTSPTRCDTDDSTENDNRDWYAVGFIIAFVLALGFMTLLKV